MQAEINSNKNMALKTMGETEEMAQYLRRDCLEISGVKVQSIAVKTSLKVLGRF